MHLLESLDAISANPLFLSNLFQENPFERRVSAKSVLITYLSITATVVALHLNVRQTLNIRHKLRSNNDYVN